MKSSEAFLQTFPIAISSEFFQKLLALEMEERDKIIKVIRESHKEMEKI